jgi:hypothetical protein
MSISAIVLMVCVWTVILGGTGYCFFKLLTSDRQFGQGGEDH